MFISKNLSLVVFIVHFSIIVLFTMLFKLLNPICLPQKPILSITVHVRNAKLSNRITRQFKPFRMNFFLHSLVITARNHTHTVDFHIGQHFSNRSFDVFFQFVPVCVCVSPRICIRLNFTRQQLSFSFGSDFAILLNLITSVLKEGNKL